MRLRPRGWAFLAAGLLSLALAYGSGRTELLYVGGLLTVLPLASLALVRIRRPRLQLVRSFTPGIVQAGHPTSARLTVRNRGRTRSTRARWWEILPWQPSATEESELPGLPVPTPRTPPRELGYELRPPRRGVFAVGPMALRLDDPFGLATSLLAVGDERELIVTPEVVPLAESSLATPADSGEARIIQRRPAGDEDDAMTREYRPGDAMRRVHWRATARHAELMVRQEEQRSLPQARIVVDTLLDGYRDAETDPDGASDAFEWVVRMLASVTVHLRRSGFAVTILETGERQLAPLGRRRTWGDEEFLAGLAGLDLVEHPRERGEARGGGPLIALIGDPAPETLTWLLRQRRPGSPAIAFAARGLVGAERLHRSFAMRTASAAAGDAAERLADDGWIVVPVRADDDPAAAWEAVVVETGRSRGSA